MNEGLFGTSAREVPIIRMQDMENNGGKRGGDKEGHLRFGLEEFTRHVYMYTRV